MRESVARSLLREGRPMSSETSRPMRAILKDAVSCSAHADQGRAHATAPRGEYEIETVECAGASCIGLCSCATQNRFTLSFDAYLQHLMEGRIALTNG